MNTPICDFVKAYCDAKAVRLHMPGHKGLSALGPEMLDITEIDGADVLYSAKGIIRQSEENAASLFGAGKTLYSAEGSSLCIRAMLYLALMYAREQGRRPLIAAARNAHKVFMTGAALLDLPIRWIFPVRQENMVSCPMDLDEVARVLEEEKPAALYVTSPDYLGGMADVRALSALCHAHGTLLLVDNAHGAYLRFLPESRHPMDLGADLCCDSAHKTLPVLTGGAYLHISPHAPQLLKEHAQQAMALFASTSPSYLILQSLDQANAYLADGYAQKLKSCAGRLEQVHRELKAYGYETVGDEPMKLTLAPKSIGWRGDELAQLLEAQGVVIEFSDPDFAVMMFTPENTEEEIQKLLKTLLTVEKKAALSEKPPMMQPPVQRMSAREALFSAQETVAVHQAVGRVLASASVNCPPAIPVVVCGEEINEDAAACFRYYGMESCCVVRK